MAGRAVIAMAAIPVGLLDPAIGRREARLELARQGNDLLPELGRIRVPRSRHEDIRLSQHGLCPLNRGNSNVPQDAVYPLNLADSEGKPLDGDNNYVLHFEKSEIPPVSGFRSVPLYDQQGYQVANNLNRFAVSSWMPFVYNTDGSLDLHFQNESPGKDKEAN